MLKENYFSNRGSAADMEKLAVELSGLKLRHPWKLNLEQCALLILDMQEYFLRPDSHAFVPAALAILPRLKVLQDCFLRVNRPVIHTRHLNQPGMSGLMEEWWRDLLQENSPYSAITPELSDPRVKIYFKNQYDAFYQTELESWLRQAGVSQLAVAGVLTHLCLESTIRSAFVRGFTCIFPVDGTATYNFGFYRGSCVNLSHGFAVPVWVEELCQQLK